MRVIGHRGAAGIAPENTIPSFRAALAAGVDEIEFDVRLTADGHAILMHDDDVSRTTDGAGYVSRMTLAEVRRLDAAARFDGWADRLQVPTLDEVLDLVSGAVPLVVELKASFDESGFRSGAPVVEAIADRLRAIPNVLVSSFDPFAVEASKRILPEKPTAMTFFVGFPPDAALDATTAGGHVEAHMPEEACTATFVERAHAAGVKVCAWTVNDPERARACVDIGVDGVFTDDPAAIRDALR